MVQKISNPIERTECLRAFDPNKQTWIVNDLKIKMDIQERLLKKNIVIEGDCVLRVSEYWEQCLYKNAPGFRIITRELALAEVEKRLSVSENSWAKKPGAATTTLNYLDTLIPVISVSGGPQLLVDWMRKNEDIYARWGHWLAEALNVWQVFVEKKWLLPKWIPTYLQSIESIQAPDKKGLIVDAGTELMPVELELFEAMSSGAAKILAPAPEWSGKFSDVLNVYGDLCEQDGRPAPKAKLETRRFVTMLSEVKDCVSWVRQLLENGVEPRDISVAATDIGEYWTPLSLHFEVEGIPTQRNRHFPLLGFTQVAQFLAALKLAKGELESESLKTVVLAENIELIERKMFDRLFSVVTGTRDLDRAKKVRDFFESLDSDSNKEIGIEDFMTFSLAIWMKVNTSKYSDSILENCLRTVYQASAPGVLLSINQWVSLTERVISKAEIKNKSQLNGIDCLDALSVEGSRYKYIYFLGASDDQMRKFKTSSMSPSDKSKIETDLGFKLDKDGLRKSEFQLNWLLEDPDLKMIVSFSETDFSGDSLSPSLSWIHLSSLNDKERESLDAFLETRWDLLQKKIEREKHTDASASILCETGRSEKESSFRGGVPSLSASSIEEYLRCPFRFFSRKHLMLSDDPHMDLDLDRMSLGKLNHSLLSYLMKDLRLHSEQEKRDLFDKCVKEEGIEFIDSFVEQSSFESASILMDRFVQSEKEYLSKYPQLKAEYLEEPFDCYLDENTFEISLKETSLRLRGRFDRVDTSGSTFIVLDYKSSTQKFHQYKSWIKNDELQMALYSYLVDQGVLDSEGEVGAALLYNIKTLKRDKGLYVKELDGHGFHIPSRSQAGATIDQKMSLYGEVKDVLKDVFYKMKNGHYPPVPKELKTCNQCEWRYMCRAPHLN